MTRVAAVVVLAFAAGGCGRKQKSRHDAGPTVGSAVTIDATLDPKQIVAQFDNQCTAGDLEACRSLAVMYTEGIGVAADPVKAAALFTQACTGGNLSACNHVALALAEGYGVDKDPTKAVALYRTTCDAGYALACRNGGLMLRDGRGVPADLALAETLLDKACTAGAPFACTNAGDLDARLANSAKTPAAHTNALKKMIAHYQRGCESKDFAACRHIGIAYLEGTGLPQSPSAASVWLGRACEANDPIACRVLGMMRLKGVGIARDPAGGREMIARACEQKDLEACRALPTIDQATAVSDDRDAGVTSVDTLNPDSGSRE